MCGRRYIVDTCISLLIKEKKEREYHIYVTDVLQSILKSQYAEAIDIPRYIDIAEPPKETKPEHTAEEIIQNISHKLDTLGK